MATVYVVKEQMIRTDSGPAPMDLAPAYEYGDIEFITKTDLPMYQNGSVMVNWAIDVARFVGKYNPSIDFIVPTGQPAAIMAIGYLLGRAGKVPRFLVWRREEQRYRVIHMGAEAVGA